MKKAIRVAGKIKFEYLCNYYQTLLVEDDLVIEYKDVSDLHLLIINVADKAIKLKEYGSIKENVEIFYIDFNSFSFEQDCELNLLANSSLNIESYYLAVQSGKTIKFKLTDAKERAHCTIENHAVALKGGKMKLAILGSILKGAKQSDMHQTTRCLTLDSPKDVECEPILLIDESDVEAGHALSVGTIDDEILYYMNTRGLNRQKAMLLLVHGYLLRDSSKFANFPQAQEIIEKEKRRVEESCLTLMN